MADSVRPNSPSSTCSPDSGGGGDTTSKSGSQLRVRGKVINTVGMKRTANFYAEFRDETRSFNKKEDQMLHRQLRVLQRQERVANHALRKTRQEAERLRTCVRNTSERTLDLSEYDEIKRQQRFANYRGTPPPTLATLPNKKVSALNASSGAGDLSGSLQSLLRRRSHFSKGRGGGDEGRGFGLRSVKLPSIDATQQQMRPIYDQRSTLHNKKHNNNNNIATVAGENNNNTARPLARLTRDPNNNSPLARGQQQIDATMNQLLANHAQTIPVHNLVFSAAFQHPSSLDADKKAQISASDATASSSQQNVKNTREKLDPLTPLNHNSSNSSATSGRVAPSKRRLLERRPQLDKCEEQQTLTLRALQHTKTGDMIDAFFASQKQSDVTERGAKRDATGSASSGVKEAETRWPSQSGSGADAE